MSDIRDEPSTVGQKGDGILDDVRGESEIFKCDNVDTVIEDGYRLTVDLGTIGAHILFDGPVRVLRFEYWRRPDGPETTFDDPGNA